MNPTNTVIFIVNGHDYSQMATAAYWILYPVVVALVSYVVKHHADIGRLLARVRALEDAGQPKAS